MVVMPDHKKARLLIEEAGLVRMSGLDQAWHLLRLRSRTVHSRLARNVMQNGCLLYTSDAADE